MATLVEGQQYGLSSQGNDSTNKSFIFVKLTDSALRALEEYQKLRANASWHPGIHFESNEGVITIPRPETSSHLSFSFSLANVESEAPQGSFECLQQTSSRSLESLGCMMHKMQIHASEDSYEQTKVKMAVVEQQSKQNCTKVIKASGPYVGRKVKVKSHSSKIPKSCSPSPPHSTPVAMKQPIPKPLSNNQVNSRSSPINRSENQDIRRKSYRERIIHLLALRPYKKPELLARLMKDGIKDKDKKGLTAILCQIATHKENTYSLARHCWAEVNEDWPFYTPEDRETLKRVMRPSMTPDTSESEQHSPASIHSNSSSSPPQKRGMPGSTPQQAAKKPRISHFFRQDLNDDSFLYKQDSMGFDGIKSDLLATVNGGKLNDFSRSEWDLPFRTDISGHSSPFLENGSPPRTALELLGINADFQNCWPGLALNGRIDSSPSHFSLDSSSEFLDKHDYLSRSKSLICVSDLHRDRYSRIHNISTSNGSGSRGSTPQSSPDSRDSLDYRGSSSLNSSPPSPEAPVYAMKYVSISNGEQRSRYKADFNAEYEEYRRLHAFIEQVSKRFANLEDAFRNCKEGTEEWHHVKNEIMKEYEEKKRVKYPDARRRFQYLHKKLSHIKRLISDYDQSQNQLHIR